MSWRNWLHKLASWDMVLQLTAVFLMVVIAIALVAVENCAGTRVTTEPLSLEASQ